MIDTHPLFQTHDLRLPDWGPYTKKYPGISHLPDMRSGMRFDLSVFPGFYRRQVLVPNAKWESAHHAWEAAPDLSYYAYRYELEWKDQVTCDVSFSTLGPQARLVRSEFNNHTAQSQNLVLHYAAYLNFPPVRTYSDEPVQPSRPNLPNGAVWIDALDYADQRFASPRPQDTLGYDGGWRGETRGHGFVNGCGLGQGFGRGQGDWVRYTLPATDLSEAVLLLRYRALEGPAAFELDGLAAGRLELAASAEFALVPVWQGRLPAGPQTLQLTALGGAAVELDGFVLAPQAEAGKVSFALIQWQHVPQILPGPRPNSLILKYADTPVYYGLAWLGEPWVLRELYTAELDRFMRHYVHEHVQKIMHGSGEGHFTNVFVRPIEVPPGETRVLFGLTCSGTRAEVEEALGQIDAPPEQLETIYQRARAGVSRLEPTPSGERYRFGQELMAATLLTNVTYPVYTRRSYIRHYTPGKWWDCLYTWDSGFIGLGLLELDINRAVDCLNAYTTPVGDPQAAFLHHGSMVPTQHYLFHELWNRTQDRGLLEYFYPRLRQYYQFFAGRLGSSTTRKMQSGLLKTWDCLYNSSWWDDYPPQVQIHANRLEDSATPVISTSHAIRIAKILQQAARAGGAAADIAEYQADIDLWTHALNRYAWDPASGYYGYVLHTAAGQPREILRHSGGQNYNMGLDGASPFFAGVCDPAQEQQIFERLTSPQRLWTRIGLTTVDQTAAYYKVDGYWNGAVWFPQQWFFWKAALDQNRGAFAAQIAQTALETWKNETDASYQCFEHFIVQSGRGAGWHQFSGLSTPVLGWYGAYHRTGRLTVGLDAWVERQQFSAGNRQLEAELTLPADARPGLVLATMAPGGVYQATWNGQPAPFYERYPGMLEIRLPAGAGRGVLMVGE